MVRCGWLVGLVVAMASCQLQTSTGLGPTTARPSTTDDRVVASAPSAAVVMPDLHGLTRDDALATLQRAGIVGELQSNPSLACTDRDRVAKGRVCYQSPLAGAQTLARSPVTVLYETREGP